jgi:prepilin-type processing-associated H-X9-DG protein
MPEFELGGLFWFNAKKAESLARTDYAASVGDRFVYWSAGPIPEEAEAGKGFFKFHDLNGQEATLQDVNGVVVQRQPFTMAQIFDGASQTYFAGEKSIPIEAHEAGWNPNDDQSCWNGDDLDTVATTEFVMRLDYSVKTKQAGRVGVPFGSAHRDGVNMLFCDGSVQMVTYDVDLEIHRQFGNRRDRMEAKTPAPK